LVINDLINWANPDSELGTGRKPHGKRERILRNQKPVLVGGFTNPSSGQKAVSQSMLGDRLPTTVSKMAPGAFLNQ
jgi:hypothetical protein